MSLGLSQLVTIKGKGTYKYLLETLRANLFWSTFFPSGDKSDEWNQAETLMEDYRSMLERREDLNSELAMMEEQNLKLEQELESKLKEKINEELAFPPTKMISVGPDAK